MSREFQIYIDGGYFLHFCIFSTLGRWSPPDQKLHSDLDPMDYPDFVEALEERAFSILHNLYNRILPKKIESDLPVTSYPTIISLECRSCDNWRAKVFPQYKATRKLGKKICNISTAYGHMQNLMTDPESRFVSEFNIIPVKHANSEGDDILAVLSDHIEAKQKIFVAVDRDFHQIEGIHMIDLFGRDKLVEESFKLNERGYNLSPKQYKLLKILVGDGADNIQKVFPGDGIIRCLKKYISDVNKLKCALENNPEAKAQFARNVELIDFRKIPQNISEEIILEYKKEILDYEQRRVVSLESKSTSECTVCDYSLL